MAEMKKTTSRTKKILSEIEYNTIRRNRYLIHASLRTRKINLSEWRNLLNQNYHTDQNGRKIISEYLNSLEENRINTPSFKKNEFFILIHNASRYSLIYILILILTWTFAILLNTLKGK